MTEDKAEAFINKAFFKIITIVILLFISIHTIFDFIYKKEVHAFFLHFFYVPIVFAAFWWGRKSVFLAIFLGAILLLPYGFMDDISLTNHIENVLSSIMFLVIAWTIGTLREKSLQSEKTLSNIIEGVSIPIFVINKEHVITHYNRACVALTGVPASEMLGSKKQWLPFYSEERPSIGDLIIDGASEEQIKKLYPMVRKSSHIANAFEMEDVFTLPHKGSCWLHITAAPLLDIKEEIAGAIVTLQDFTEGKLTYDALLEVQNRYQDLFDNSTDLIQCVSPEGWFIYVNNTWKKTMGYNDLDLANLNLFDVIHPECLEYCKHNFKKVLQGESLNKAEVTFITKDKRKIQLEGDVNCHFDDGKPVATRGIFKDVTESKRPEKIIQEQSRRMKLELETAIKAQYELLPAKFFEVSGAKFSWEFNPSVYMSGDMVNIFKIDKNHIRFYILDVMGHGVAAALKAITLNYLLKPPSKTSNILPPSEILRLISNRFSSEFRDQSMYTIVLGVLNLKTFELTLTRAGHCPPLIVSANGEVQELRQGGPAMGLSEKIPIKDYTIKLKPKDKLFLYTDGIIEAQNTQGERYSKNRFIDFLAQNRNMEINEITGSVVNDVKKFMESDTAEDDITLLGISLPPR